MRQKLTTRVVEFLAHFHVRVRECARTGTFLLLTPKVVASPETSSGHLPPLASFVLSLRYDLYFIIVIFL